MYTNTKTDAEIAEVVPAIEIIISHMADYLSCKELDALEVLLKGVETRQVTTDERLVTSSNTLAETMKKRINERLDGMSPKQLITLYKRLTNVRENGLDLILKAYSGR